MAITRNVQVKLGHSRALNKEEQQTQDSFFGKHTTEAEHLMVKSFEVTNRGHSVFINGFNSKK